MALENGWVSPLTHVLEKATRLRLDDGVVRAIRNDARKALSNHVDPLAAAPGAAPATATTDDHERSDNPLHNYWQKRLHPRCIPGWELPLLEMYKYNILTHLAESMDNFEERTGYKGVLAPTRAKTFANLEQLPLNRVRVVILAQDPYPSKVKTASIVAKANALPPDELARHLGEGYESWEMAQPATVATDEKLRARIITRAKAVAAEEGKTLSREDIDRLLEEAESKTYIGAIPYACGKAFAYPSICEEPPNSFTKIKEALKQAYPRKKLRMDPMLDTWSNQGVLLLNACPILYRLSNGSDASSTPASGKNPNMWTAWTSSLLTAIAKERPSCIFVLLGNSAKAFKKDIVNANGDACVIEAVHPSRSDTFPEEMIFTRINEYLTVIGEPAIEW